MALSYSDIRDIYDPIKSSGATTEDLPSWSARMNELTGTNSYDAGLHDNWIKRASHAIDTVINATGLPGYTEQFGRSVGELVGAPEAGAAIGHGIPRSVVNFAPLLIPGVGWAGAAARLGLTGALSGAEAYEQTGSPLSSLISGGVSAGLPGVAGKVSETTAGLLSKLVASRAAARVGGEVAGQLAGAGVVGATQPLEQLARGEQPTSPFTVENALGLTLGQAPFAALHLAGRAISGFPSLDRTLKLAQQKTNLTETKNAIEDQTGVEQIPDITPKVPPEVSAKTLKETQVLLAQVRGEQIAIKDNPTLTDDQKLAQENLLSNQEFELLRKREFESEFAPGNTILGDSIQTEMPRQDLLGTEIKRNKTGTWRVVYVADDPANPEPFRGKVVKYSTIGEPAPVETGQGRLAQYSVPDARYHTVVTPEEWDSRFRKSPDTGQPELPTTGTMTAEQVSASMNELAGIHTEVDQATTPGDLQKTIVKLGDVEQEHNFNPTNDAVLKPAVEKLADKGLNPDEATKAAVKAQASRTARKVQADAQSSLREQERAVPELTPEQAAEVSAKMEGKGYSVITADKLSHAHTEDNFDTQPIKDVVTDAAVAAARTPEAKAAFDTWPDREDTSYEKDFADFVDLIQQYGSLSKVPPKEAGQFLADRSGTVAWSPKEVKEFINRPHVQAWSRGLDAELTRMNQGVNAPVPQQQIDQEAVKRRNIEPDGRIWSSGELVEPTKENADKVINEAKSNLNRYETTLKELTNAKNENPNASIAEVQSYLPADSSEANWDEAINRYKTMVGQSRQYITDIQNVNAAFEKPGAFAPGTVSRENAPIWQPLDPRDTETMQRMGIAQGGRGMLNFLAQSKNPIFSALAKDLAKFGESLDRITGSVRQIDSGAFVKRLPGDKYEVSLSPSILRSDDYTKEFSIAHELVHGLTLSELDNPTKASIRQEFDNLRQRVIDALPKDMKSAINKALNDNWQDKWAKREVSYESLMPDGTAQQRNILYGLLNTHEFVAQGLSENSFRQQLQSIETHVKARPGTWFNKFVNLVRTILGIGEKVNGTAFEEFLARSSQLLERGDYVSSFRNFSDRYFENLGLNKQFVDNYTQRAMGLLLSNPRSTLEALQLLRDGAGGIRSPDWVASQRNIIKMFNERGDDAMVTQKVLDETGHTPNASGLLDLAESLMTGEVGHDVVDLLPETVAKHIFLTAQDAQNVLGVIRAATLEGNKGILNIANPELIRGITKETLKGVDQVVAAQKIQEQKVRDIQGLFSVPPDGFMHSMISAPEAVPEWMSNEPKKSVFDYISRFLEPQNQVARRIPQAAEAISKGHQLRANVRDMARESLKALGMDLDTMQLTPKTVKAMFKVFQNSTLRKAADQWIATNNIEGEKQNAIKVLDADDPRIQKILTGLSPTDRGIVEDMVNKHSISTQHFQDQQLEKHLQISSTEGGQLLQRLAPNLKLKDAVDISSRLLNAFTANRNDPVAATAADGEIRRIQGQLDPDTFLTVARFAKSAADSWTEYKNYFQQNPGWSTARAYGKYIIEFKRGNKTILDAVDSRKEADQRAEGRPYKLTKNNEYDENKPPSLGYNAGEIADRLRQLEQNRMDILRNTGAFTEDQLALEKKYSAAEQFITEETYRGGVPNLQPQARGLGKGAEERAWLRNHVSWIHQASNYWSRRLLRSQARAVLADPEISQNPELRDNLETHFENMMQPDTRVGKFMQRMAMMWFMGFNPASALINGTQPFLTHVAELTAMTGKPLDSYRRVLGALKEVAGSGIGHLEWKDPVTREFMSRFIKDGEADVSMFDDQAAGNELLHTNLVRMLNGDKPQTLGQKLSTLNGNLATAGMWMFKTVERINAMAAGIAGYKYYRESQPNLSPDEVYAKAVEFHHSVNYGGGAANRPTGAFAGRGAFPRTVAMLATAMQSYNLGTMFQLARYIRSGFFRPEGLTPAEIHSARKAAVQMLGTQLAAAGVLGLPFVSGMLSVLNQAFPGLEVNRKLRESMDALTGGDEDNGHVLTDIGMTGAPSMFGWDLQSRLSMGNTLPGVSEVNGFEPENLLGAPANLVANFIRGGQKLASGQPHAVDAFVPSALKKFEQLLRSGGQVLDYRDRPIFTPTLGEKVGIALGFQPKRLTDYNTASRIAKQADDNIKAREGQFHQQMAGEVLKGNFGNVRQALLQRSREDKTYDPIQAVRSISGAAEELTFPRDLRREGTLAAGDVRNRLLATFNIPPTQPSETDRYRFRQSVEQRLGLMTTSPTGLQTATVMDELRRNNPTATRAELRQQMTTLSRGHRLQSLSSLEE